MGLPFINQIYMTIVNILRDGSVYPPLKPGSLIIKLMNCNLEIGKYEKELYLKEYEQYITEPGNSVELKKELLKMINTSMPDLFSKHYVVHLSCPASISQKIIW
jgi:hypothetical protein